MFLTHLSYLYFLIHTTVISSSVWNIKCHRTKLEEDIHDFTRNGSLIYLPKLETLKRKYPGDKGCFSEFLFFVLLAITTSNLHQIQKVRSVLKSAGSKDFKTDLTFDIWPSRS